MNSSAHTHRPLDAISVKVEMSSGNVPSLLHEIRHALGLLLEGGVSTTIDLKRIPLAPGEEERIVQILGSGEIHAELQAYGRSDFTETAYPGVWLVTHFDVDGGQTARFIEITRVPEMLCSHADDISSGLKRLQGFLAANGSAK
jgi:hydrogenase-1 operon protein HyaF